MDPIVDSKSAALDLSSEEVRTLVDLGFIALMRGQTKCAEALFRGVQAARPQEDAGHIGAALVLLHAGDAASAVRLLRARAPKDANRVFLGLALLRLGDFAEAEEVLKDVVATGQEQALSELATTMLTSYPETERMLLPR